MERIPVPTLLIFALLCMATSRSTASLVYQTGSTDFIKDSCSATLYPALCVQSLSVYASNIQNNPKQLAQTALTVSLARAQSVSAFVSKLAAGANGMKLRERAAVKDCIENVGDSVDQLARSVLEMGRTGRVGSESFLWHVSNVQTWVSAALTDETTCVDGLAGPAINANLKATVRGRIVIVAQVTSNALALVNRYAEGHGTTAKNP